MIMMIIWHMFRLDKVISSHPGGSDNHFYGVDNSLFLKPIRQHVLNPVQIEPDAANCIFFFFPSVMDLKSRIL